MTGELAKFDALFRAFPLDGGPVHLRDAATEMDLTEEQVRARIGAYRKPEFHGYDGWILSDGHGTNGFYRASSRPPGVGPGNWKYPHARHLTDGDG